MHHALETIDIVLTILDHLKSSPKDLRNVAMTCSSLADSALSILWSEQSNLAPLIMCLPQDTWEVKCCTINFTREPLPTEWGRVIIYASRIRRLLNNYAKVPKIKVSDHVLLSLFARFPSSILFPQLCLLDYEAISNLPALTSNFLLLQQLFTPTLETLWFDIPQGVPTHQVEELVGILPVAAYGLRQLSISAAQGTSALTVLPSFGKLPKLIRLVIDGIDLGLTRQTITNVQQTRCLQTLILTLHESSHDVENLPTDDMPLEFSTLKELYLSGDSLPQCTYFLGQITTPHLSSIRIKYWTPASQTEIAEFIESLSTSCQTFSYLEKIRLTDESHENPDPEPSIELPSQVFRPLLNFSRLLSVVFVGIGNYDLDDAFINHAAVAWPHIRELKFASERRGTCNVTLTAMMSFASKCRSLRVLHLTFDATQWPTVPRAPDRTGKFWPKQTALHKLHVGHSKVAETAHLPCFLAGVFPNLLDFEWYPLIWSSESAMRSKLVEAQQQLKLLRTRDDSDEEWHCKEHSMI
ncbi:hypothetical protein EDB19DRAFT_1877937 [Suillus lakei]|nr:hypothetical protein EDB19DRAFT_1877937 [Suillus lakei]